MKIGNIEFKENEKHILEEAGNVISDYGMGELTYFINRLFSKYNRRDVYLYTNDFEELFDNRWIVPKAKYSGTFPKRVQNIFYKEYQIKLSVEDVQEIGNLARQHTQSDIKYIFDVTQNLNWRAGDFGDEDSCYWQSREGARSMITEAGGGALRFYRPEDNYPYYLGPGLARCWIIPYNDLFIIFNGYSGDNPYAVTLLQMARTLSSYCGLAYYRVSSLVNHGTDSGVLWINGGSGYMIGEPDKIEEVKNRTIDFQIEEIDINTYHCEHCDYSIDEEDGYWTPDGQGLWCSICFHDHYVECYRCDEYNHYNDTTETVDGYFFCEPCAHNYLYCCAECGDWYRQNLPYIEDVGYLCESCKTEYEERKESESESSLSTI